MSLQLFILASYDILTTKDQVEILLKLMKQFHSYVAKYTKITNGYIGQILEWPEVITEGSTLEECRYMLRDALNEMILAYNEIGKEIPISHVLIELLPVETSLVSKAA
jgi:predicted RNase H-like HicB family nuclease